MPLKTRTEANKPSARVLSNQSRVKQIKAELRTFYGSFESSSLFFVINHISDFISGNFHGKTS